MSFYWAVVTMATLGFGDIKPYTTHEIVMVIICLTAGKCLHFSSLGTALFAISFAKFLYLFTDLHKT